MARTSKDPEERKSELIDAAEELFVSKGYEQTAVSDIVRKVGVAQGLFYYYFKAKDEILGAITQKYISHLLKGVRKIVEDKNSDAITKVHLVIEEFINILGIKRKGFMSFANHMHKEENSAIHQRLAKKMIEQLSPILSGIVKQGVSEGVFDTSYPDEVTEFILTWGGLSHSSIKLPLEDKEGFIRKTEAVEDVIERMLGAQKGSIKLKRYMEVLFD